MSDSNTNEKVIFTEFVGDAEFVILADVKQRFVYANYQGESQFLIPADVKEYSILWDTLTYTDKDGNKVEVTPFYSLEEDVELQKRPNDIWEEEDLGQSAPACFLEYYDHMSKEQILELLWGRMRVKDRKEIVSFMKKDSEPRADESCQTKPPTDSSEI